MRRFTWMLAACLAFACAEEPPAVPAADVVLSGGAVYTAVPGAPLAEAVALRGERIVWVGDAAGAARFIGPRTRVVDLAGRMAMPGLVDGHVHPGAGGALLRSCLLDYAELTGDALRAKLAACLAAEPSAAADRWLVAAAWNAQGTQPPGAVLTRRDLDALATPRPILVRGADGHTALANTRALTIARVSAETPDPPGGKLVRDARGEPTGLLLDAAIELVNGAIPVRAEDVLANTRTAMRHLNALGVTSVFDAAAGEPEIAAWATLRDAGKLTLRTSAAMVVAPEEMRDPAAAVARLAALQQRHAGGPLRVRTAKFFADGVMELPAQTAALLEPYLENGKPGANRGALYFDPAAFTRSVVAFDAAGFAVHVHAIGDAAVRAALDAFAAARDANGGALRARGAITHLELVDPVDLPRFAALDVTASFSPQWALSDAYTREALEPFLGPEREARLYPIRSLAAAGAPLAFGSDWPVDPSDRFDAIETALTRRGSEPGARPEPLGAHEAVDLDTALAAYTRGAARQLEIDAEVGTLAPGRLADVIVLDRDLFTTPPEAIGDTVVLATFLGGRAVYEAAPGFDTPRPAP